MLAANFFVSIGEIELMSMTSLPGASPSATPRSPNSTSPTCGVSGTMVMTMSAERATASWPRTVFKPLSINACAGLLRWSLATTA
jgi:hypothetical protein